MIIIYHTNDMHGRFEAVEEIKKIKKEKNTLILDSGDALKGSNTVFLLKEPIIEKMNKAQYDAMAMGNREFNYIRWVLKTRHKQANFPILCANLKDFRGDGNKYFKKYIVKKIEDKKIALIGATPVQYPKNSFWYHIMGFEFIEPIKAIKNIVDELRNNHINLIILLSHLGIYKDKEIAQNIPQISIILGGHTHTPLNKPLKVNNTYILQEPPFGKGYGKIIVNLKEKELLSKYQMIPTNLLGEPLFSEKLGSSPKPPP